MNTVRVCGGVAGAIVAVSVPQVVVDDAVTAAPARVVLGVSQGKYSMGYGEVRPSTLTSNSMCANVISKIKWTSWGGAKARGHGVFCQSAGAEYRGEPIQRATLVAWDIGICGGKRSYRKLSIDGWKATNICRAY